MTKTFSQISKIFGKRIGLSENLLKTADEVPLKYSTMTNKRLKYVILSLKKKYELHMLLLFKYEIVKRLFQPSYNKLALYCHQKYPVKTLKRYLYKKNLSCYDGVFATLPHSKFLLNPFR